MKQNELELLKELTESFGPSGFEREPANIIKKYVEAFADDIITDKLVSVMFKLKGSSNKPTIMIPGHIDEIGFILSGIDKSGFLTFKQLGGWIDQVLLGQRVTIRTNKGDKLGIIEAKPPHLLKPEERSRLITKDECISIVVVQVKKKQ